MKIRYTKWIPFIFLHRFELCRWKPGRAVYILLFYLSVCYGSAVSAEEGFFLITHKEYLQQLEYQSAPLEKSIQTKKSIDYNRPGSPKILGLSPNTEIELNIPVDITVDFKANDDAKIQINSLQVLYGFFEFDITERIKKCLYHSFRNTCEKC